MDGQRSGACSCKLYGIPTLHPIQCSAVLYQGLYTPPPPVCHKQASKRQVSHIDCHTPCVLVLQEGGYPPPPKSNALSEQQ